MTCAPPCCLGFALSLLFFSLNTWPKLLININELRHRPWLPIAVGYPKNEEVFTAKRTLLSSIAFIGSLGSVDSILVGSVVGKSLRNDGKMLVKVSMSLFWQFVNLPASLKRGSVKLVMGVESSEKMEIGLGRD